MPNATDSITLAMAVKASAVAVRSPTGNTCAGVLYESAAILVARLPPYVRSYSTASRIKSISLSHLTLL